MRKIIGFAFLCLALNISNAKAFSPEKVTDLDSTLSSEIIIPSVFSPNGDNNNDLFKVTGHFIQSETKIYNRFGELLFKSTQSNEGWNGKTTAGSNAPDGTYFYIIEIDQKIYKGSLTLLR